jgi:hypothetical protein
MLRGRALHTGCLSARQQKSSSNRPLRAPLPAPHAAAYKLSAAGGSLRLDPAGCGAVKRSAGRQQQQLQHERQPQKRSGGRAVAAAAQAGDHLGDQLGDQAPGIRDWLAQAAAQLDAFYRFTRCVRAGGRLVHLRVAAPWLGSVVFLPAFVTAYAYYDSTYILIKPTLCVYI